MDIYPEKEHWLGGVFVAPEHRGEQIATGVIHKALEKAKALHVETLYLQTEYLDGGLYRRLGWRPLDRVNYHGLDVLVMEKKLTRPEPS
jgi:GNAT superfamily N-acetyltransferase